MIPATGCHPPVTLISIPFMPAISCSHNLFIKSYPPFDSSSHVLICRCHSAAQDAPSTDPSCEQAGHPRASNCCDNQANGSCDALPDMKEQVDGGEALVQKAGSGAAGSPPGPQTATTDSQICKQADGGPGEQDYEDDDVCSSDAKTRDDVEQDEEEENEEQIKEYLNRTDTAVIFPEPVSVFGVKDCLNKDPEQDKERGDEMRSKVTGSASEYLIC